MRFIKLIFFLLITLPAIAQRPQSDPLWLQGYWKASWISASDSPQRDYGIYHFRKTFNLPAKPARFLVHVTADNRYRLFVNGKPVLSGPARGDRFNWYYETIDLAPHLQAGANVVAALVWNMGEYASVGQVSNQTAFLMQGDADTEQLLNTNASWKVFHDTAYSPCSLDDGKRLRTYMVIGPGDSLRANAFPWNWEQPGYNDNSWEAARPFSVPVAFRYGSDNSWSLVPRSIPFMEESLQRLGKVRRTTGGVQVTDAFLQGKQSVTIPAGRTVSILLDQTHNTVAYPQLLVSKGKGSNIRMTYAEALFNNFKKEHRDKIDGMEIMGNYDVFQPDGGDKRMFRPLWLRTYRYLQLDITTGSEPLVIDDLYGMFTGYPFEEKGSFTSNDPSLTEIWKVGWRTARLCAGETYYDCPYYEQLQYEGDTRIQSLISLYVSGDDRLMRKAIHDFYTSRVPEGLTQGRYPSQRLQVIPPFSLYWVSMVHDYWMHRKDDEFVKQYLTSIQHVLQWFENKIDQRTNMLGPLTWWNFTDWASTFKDGVPEGAITGNSSILSMHFAYTLPQAADLFEAYGYTHEANRFRQLAKRITTATYALCFDQQKGEMANTPEKKAFSQHAGIMGVLSGAVPAANEKAVMKKLLSDTSLVQATIYYRFYLMRALIKAGMADQYYSQLGSWRDMLNIGLTTFAEKEEPTRSDCHAWSASPNYDFLATICGIVPASPGFGTVKIAPALGELKEVTGKMPHPEGEIAVSFKRKGSNGLTGVVRLPGKLKGTFVWNGKTIALKPGEQQVAL